MKLYIPIEKYTSDAFEGRWVINIQISCIEIYSQYLYNNKWDDVKEHGTYLVLSFDELPKFAKIFQSIHKNLILK